MAFTASALSFMLENLAKPVILTGSQLPIGEIRTDARENLVTSIEIAAAKENGLPLVPEVAIYFDYNLLRGNRSKKTHSQKFEAFQSPNYPKLAKAGTEIVYHKTFILSPTNKPLIAHKNLDFSANIAVLKLFPGISKKYVENLVADLSLDALIIEAYGIGNAPSEDWFLNAIRSLADRGIPIIDISQCLGGSVELGKYETSNGLLKAGVISGKDLTFEACVTKLMFLFAKKLPPNEVSKWMKSALAGELSV
jgi:L-asparaginase